MVWVYPTSRAPYSLREFLKSINIQDIPPTDLAILFFLPLSVVPDVWPVFMCMFSTRYLGRNIRIWWRGRTSLDDVIFTSKLSSFQLAIYWVLRGQFFLSLVTSPKIPLKIWLVSETARSGLLKEPIKVIICVNIR